MNEAEMFRRVARDQQYRDEIMGYCRARQGERVDLPCGSIVVMPAPRGASGFAYSHGTNDVVE